MVRFILFRHHRKDYLSLGVVPRKVHLQRIHFALLQEDAQQEDQSEGFGKRRQRVLQLNRLDQGQQYRWMWYGAVLCCGLRIAWRSEDAWIERRRHWLQSRWNEQGRIYRAVGRMAFQQGNWTADTRILQRLHIRFSFGVAPIFRRTRTRASSLRDARNWLWRLAEKHGLQTLCASSRLNYSIVINSVTLSEQTNNLVGTVSSGDLTCFIDWFKSI